MSGTALVPLLLYSLPHVVVECDSEYKRDYCDYLSFVPSPTPTPEAAHLLGAIDKYRSARTAYAIQSLVALPDPGREHEMHVALITTMPGASGSAL